MTQDTNVAELIETLTEKEIKPKLSFIYKIQQYKDDNSSTMLRIIKANLSNPSMKWADDVCGVYINPFSNCQTYSIRFMQGLLALPDYDAKVLLLNIQNIMCKNQIIVDVNTYSKDKILRLFSKEEINMVAPYENTNGTNMFIILIKTHNLQKTLKEQFRNNSFTEIKREVK